MRVEITETKLRHHDKETDKHYSQVRGDVITVPDHVGVLWCKYGWAKDVDGNVATGERIPGARKPLEVHNAIGGN